MSHRKWFSYVRAIALSVAVALLILGFAASNSPADDQDSKWLMFGNSYDNTANNPKEDTISTQNVARLAAKWVATTGGDVSARPAVDKGVLYFPDWGGNLSALDARAGTTIWSHQFGDYVSPLATSLVPAVIRASPAIDGKTLYVGTQQGAYLLAIDAKTGALRWKTQLDTDPFAIITASAAIYGDVVYTGVASLDEFLDGTPGFTCCSFRGSAVAVDANSGKILWKTYTAPPGYTGSSVWGSSPAVDPGRNTVFIGTGNNYTTPTDPAYLACISAGGAQGSCLSPSDYVDSVVALDMSTGNVKWSQRLSNGDDWNGACIDGNVTGACPQGSGPDYDFGSGPNEFTVGKGKTAKMIVGAGQKSGIYSAFDPDSGKLLWATQVGPGSFLGGIQWGSATDGERVYVAISNLFGIAYGGGNAGSWSALDAATGNILWQTADPNGATDTGPMAVANGVVYAPSLAGGPTDKNMFALDSVTGNVLWTYASGASVNAGAVIVDGVVYWGSGYANVLGTPNNKFFAFSLEGH
jgi:polyvinyl alcohol dehydrogenase (cytochrome)